MQHRSEMETQLVNGLGLDHGGRHPDQLSFHLGSVLHLHQLNHVQVDGLVIDLDCLHSVHNQWSELGGKLWMNFSAKTGGRDVSQDVFLFITSQLNLHVVQNLQSFFLGLIKPFSDDPGVKTLGDLEVCLLQVLPYQQDSGGCSISSDVILSSGSPGNKTGCWMLDLHLMEQHITILGDLDITSSSNQHLHGSLGSQVGLENILDTLGTTNIHSQSLRGSSHLSFGV